MANNKELFYLFYLHCLHIKIKNIIICKGIQILMIKSYKKPFLLILYLPPVSVAFLPFTFNLLDSLFHLSVTPPKRCH